MPDRIKVFHLEDYKIIRDGVRLLLSQDHNITVVGEAQKGEQLLSMLPTTKIDVLLLDLYLDSMEHVETPNGFEICAKIRKLAPQIKILALSVYDDADRVSKIIKAGAMGFISKKASYQELLHGIKVVATGKKYICKETAKRLKNTSKFLLGLEDQLESTEDFFSKREKQVLELLAEGYSTREIAQQLFITEKTVESHRKNLVSKAQVKNTVELIAYASNKGVIKK
jgi:DNA-binding NarL/FixJ family response regulator